MKIPPSRVIGCGLIVALAGCQQSYPLASRYIKSVPVQASQGALVTVDPSESQELAGASISIPAGALERDTTVTVELGLEKLATGPDTSVSQVAVWGPAGTKLASPAEVVLPFTLPATESADGLRVNLLRGDGTKVALDRVAFTVDGTNQAARFRLDELAALEVEVSHCGADHPCADGTVCREGTCVAPTCGTSVCVSGQLCCDNHCQTVEPGTTTCPVPQCSLDHPCADGFLCDGGVCWQRCGDLRPACPTGTVCSTNGICVHAPTTECGPDRPCDHGSVCDSGVCHLRCGPDFPDQHCTAPQVCVENYVCR
ncbi:MAG TPA: hypothetical protein VND93_17650 [Myxococcales bacterium]|nr:hypothetical protein [Myxococcales bacterium]